MGIISRWFCVVVTTVGSEDSSQAQTMSVTICCPDAADSGGDRFLNSKFLNPYGKLSTRHRFSFSRLGKAVGCRHSMLMALDYIFLDYSGISYE